MGVLHRACFCHASCDDVCYDVARLNHGEEQLRDLSETADRIQIRLPECTYADNVCQAAAIVRDRTHPRTDNMLPRTKPIMVAQALMPSLPNTTHTSTVPSRILAPTPQRTHFAGTSLSGGSSSSSARSPLRFRPARSFTNSQATGTSETRLSDTMTASATHRIQPRAPVAMSPTGPGLQPESFASGERTPHPTSMPMFMLSAMGKPMMIPWPTYERLGLKDHSHSRARWVPKSGIAKSTGKKYAATCAQHEGRVCMRRKCVAYGETCGCAEAVEQVGPALFLHNFTLDVLRHVVGKYAGFLMCYVVRVESFVSASVGEGVRLRKRFVVQDRDELGSSSSAREGELLLDNLQWTRE